MNRCIQELHLITKYKYKCHFRKSISETVSNVCNFIIIRLNLKPQIVAKFYKVCFTVNMKFSITVK
jgi:hypothetical protein